ncbi:CHAT domain-containing protein [Streptomyces microflavus]|uniref:CHAT domain-containing protein n=1 Tax=Streptomyces microflavus TaxID=1919 RepID=UPI00382374B1
MTHVPSDLVLDIQHNPSADYTRLPRPRGRSGGPPTEEGQQALDLVVSLRRHDRDKLHISAYRPGERTPRTRGHRAYLEISASLLLRKAARLRAVWRDRLVRYYTTDDRGLSASYPFADTVDVSSLASIATQLTDELAEEGRYLLDEMFAGQAADLSMFRDYLTEVLAEPGPLRISFDSDLHLPWAMLAVTSSDEDPWTDFLGHRHQIEQTGAAYPSVRSEYAARNKPVTSLNTDDALEAVGRAPEVRKLLEIRSELTVRTESAGLLEALSRAVLDEDVMYFWCHGQFVDNDSRYEQLAVRLSDDRNIDADLVRMGRRRHMGAPDAKFRPFVLLNACHTGQSAAAELDHLGRALIELGADGVLGPQIEIPQRFAAEYAFAFLDLYLTGQWTAGEITWQLVRRFASEYHNPLALTYSLHCGIDSFLKLAP